MRLFLITLVISLIGCSTTVPVVSKFPDAPGKLATEKCPNLNKLGEDAKLSDVAKTVTGNYSEYYLCAVKVDAWIEWYNIQKHIYGDLK